MLLVWDHPREPRTRSAQRYKLSFDILFPLHAARRTYRHQATRRLRKATKGTLKNRFYTTSPHVRFGSEADICSAATHVRFGSKADMCSANGHVCFTPNSGHVQCKTECLLRAKSGLMQCSKRIAIR